MTTMNISLPDEMKAFIEAQMEREGYASASEYLRHWFATPRSGKPGRTWRRSCSKGCRDRPLR